MDTENSGTALAALAKQLGSVLSELDTLEGEANPMGGGGTLAELEARRKARQVRDGAIAPRNVPARGGSRV